MLSAPRAPTTTLQAPALLWCQATSSLHLQAKERDYPKATLCSWRAASCSPAGPELLLMQLQDPSPCSTGYSSGLSTSFCTSSLPVLHQHLSLELWQVECPACASTRTEQALKGTLVPPAVPAPALHGSITSLGALPGREDRHPKLSCPVRAHLNTTHTISRGV